MPSHASASAPRDKHAEDDAPARHAALAQQEQADARQVERAKEHIARSPQQRRRTLQLAVKAVECPQRIGERV